MNKKAVDEIARAGEGVAHKEYGVGGEFFFSQSCCFGLWGLRGSLWLGSVGYKLTCEFI